MSTIKISALPAASGIDGTADVFPIVQSSITNKITRNTFLGITGSPVGNTDVQTLSSKTINNTNAITILDGSFTLQNTGATTRQAVFSLASITAGQTRTLTIPDASLTIVGTATTQTLTSKTLTAPTITSPSVTGTVSGGATYSSPVLTTPTIADFTNATHNHSNAAGGGATLTSPTITTPIISTPTIRAWDGWEDANESWSFGSATAITVPSDATTKYSVGDKIKMTQSATVKYFDVISVASTTLTVRGVQTETVANSAISANFYSKVQTPLNYALDGVAWWQELGRTTLTPAGNTITVNNIPARKYLRILIATQPTGGTTNHFLSFNNDSGTNYNYRYSSNGAADTTSSGVGPQVQALAPGTAAQQGNLSLEVTNITAQEKYFEFVGWRPGAAGAAVPDRQEGVGKWVNTAAQVTRVDLTNTGTGNFAIGSEIVVLGHD